MHSFAIRSGSKDISKPMENDANFKHHTCVSITEQLRSEHIAPSFNLPDIEKMFDVCPPTKRELCTLAHIRYMQTILHDEMCTTKILIDRRMALCNRKFDVVSTKLQEESSKSRPLQKECSFTTEILRPLVVTPNTELDKSSSLHCKHKFGASQKQHAKIIDTLGKLRDESKAHIDNVTFNGCSCNLTETMIISKVLMQQYSKIRTFYGQQREKMLDSPEHTENILRREATKHFLEAVANKSKYARQCLQESLDKRISRMSVIMSKRKKLQDLIRLACHLQGFNKQLSEQRNELNNIRKHRADIYTAEHYISPGSVESVEYRAQASNVSNLCTTIDALMAETVFLTRPSHRKHLSFFTRKNREAILDTLHSLEVQTLRAWGVAAHLRSKAARTFNDTTEFATYVNSYSKQKTNLQEKVELLRSSINFFRIAATPFSEIQTSDSSELVDLSRITAISLAKACVVASQEISFITENPCFRTEVFPIIEVTAVDDPSELTHPEATSVPLANAIIKSSIDSTFLHQTQDTRIWAQAESTQVKEDERSFYTVDEGSNTTAQTDSCDEPQKNQMESQQKLLFDVKLDNRVDSTFITHVEKAAFLVLSESFKVDERVKDLVPIESHDSPYEPAVVQHPDTRLGCSIDSTCIAQAQDTPIWAQAASTQVKEDERSFYTVDESSNTVGSTCSYDKSEEKQTVMQHSDTRLERSIDSTCIAQAQDTPIWAQADPTQVREEERSFYTTSESSNTTAQTDSHGSPYEPAVVQHSDTRLGCSIDSTCIAQAHDTPIWAQAESTQVKEDERSFYTVDESSNTVGSTCSYDKSEEKQTVMQHSDTRLERSIDSTCIAQAQDTPIWAQADPTQVREEERSFYTTSESSNTTAQTDSHGSPYEPAVVQHSDTRLERSIDSTCIAQAQDTPIWAQADPTQVREEERSFYTTSESSNTTAQTDSHGSPYEPAVVQHSDTRLGCSIDSTCIAQAHDTPIWAQAESTQVKEDERSFYTVDESSNTVGSTCSYDKSEEKQTVMQHSDTRLERSIDSTCIAQAQDTPIWAQADPTQVREEERSFYTTSESSNTTAQTNSHGSLAKQTELRSEDSQETSVDINNGFWNMSTSCSHNSIFQS